MNTFEKAAEGFVNDAYWLGDEDELIKVSLLEAARQLDKRFQTSLLSEFNKQVRYVRSLKPEDETVESELDLLLNEAN